MSNKSENKIELSDQNTVLYVIHGSRSGNSKSAAILAYEYANFLGLKSELIDMQKFDLANLPYIKNVLITVSTHGEGDPPIAAENLLRYISNGNAPSMKDTKFSVLALGDSSYRHFCKTGHDFKEKLQNLGAKEIHDLMECDIDFEENAKQWIEDSVKSFKTILPLSKTKKKSKFVFELIGAEDGNENTYKAKVLEKRILNSESKLHKTMHISLSLKNSGIKYQAGDTIGIYSSNSKRVVDKLIKLLDFDATHVIESKQKKKMLKQALVMDYELTLLTPLVIKKYAEFGSNSQLNKLLANNKWLDDYCESKDIIDLVQDFPIPLTVNELISILRKLPSRLYSVSSSQKQYPEEVHLMVRLIDFVEGERRHEGVCSSFLSTRIEDGESIGIYLEENEKFRLPEDETPLIMIGAGTGLAPYRAFLQERDHRKAKGKMWLFFGERHQSSDFYYQQELEQFLKNGLLTKLHTAFSRDHKQKLYISQLMLENSAEFFEWIKNGAVIYLCGNKRKLAKDVRTSILQIIQKEGCLSKTEASKYFKQMKANKTFMEDVY